jgi:hypothetical protein
MEWDQKPFPRLDRLSESVFDGHVKLCCAEQAVEDIFKPGTVQVVQLVGGKPMVK